MILPFAALLATTPQLHRPAAASPLRRLCSTSTLAYCSAAPHWLYRRLPLYRNCTAPLLNRSCAYCSTAPLWFYRRCTTIQQLLRRCLQLHRSCSTTAQPPLRHFAASAQPARSPTAPPLHIGSTAACRCTATAPPPPSPRNLIATPPPLLYRSCAYCFTSPLWFYRAQPLSRSFCVAACHCTAAALPPRRRLCLLPRRSTLALPPLHYDLSPLRHSFCATAPPRRSSHQNFYHRSTTTLQLLRRRFASVLELFHHRPATAPPLLSAKQRPPRQFSVLPPLHHYPAATAPPIRLSAETAPPPPRNCFASAQYQKPLRRFFFLPPLHHPPTATAPPIRLSA